MEFDIYQNSDYSVAGDTDSLFINIGKIMKITHPELDFTNIDECLPVVKKYQEDIGDKLNIYQTDIAKNLFNTDDHFFDLKPEFIFKKAYWSGKRRYAQHIVDKEGVRKDDFIMMGLDLMKSNFPKLFRDFGEQLIKDILVGKDKNKIDENIISFKESLKTIDWKQLMKPTGLKNTEKYIFSPPEDGKIFSKLQKKCPLNTKSAIISNDLIKHFKLEHKFQPFQIGDKIYTMYLKDNPYKVDVIALNGYDDAPEIMKIAKQYIDRDKMFNSVMKEKIEKMYRDLKWDNPIYNKKITQFFKF